MFHSARLTLTAWYIVIIMCICAFFSVAIYQQLSREVEHSLRTQRIRIELENGIIPSPFSQTPPDMQVLEDAQHRLQLTILIVNAGILVLAGGAAYFLAGKTLMPIEKMVDEQHRFIADASHELKTPLTALRTSLEVNLRDKKLTTIELRSLLKSNLEDVQTLQQLTDRLLTLTLLDGSELPMTTIAIKDVIDKSIQKLKPQAAAKQITIVYEPTEDTVAGDPSSLAEVLAILLDNAIKYSDQQTQIVITTATTDRFVTISVTDQGIGIVQKDLPHIFDRFYRVDVARSNNLTPGYGLGLAIAKQIVEQHHGKITVQSTAGMGTIFTIVLPKNGSSRAYI